MSGIDESLFQTSLRDRFEELSKRNPGSMEMPDLSGFVTWDRLEDALKGIQESLEKSSNDAALALASTRDNRSTQSVSNPSVSHSIIS